MLLHADMVMVIQPVTKHTLPKPYVSCTSQSLLFHGQVVPYIKRMAYAYPMHDCTSCCKTASGLHGRVPSSS